MKRRREEFAAFWRLLSKSMYPAASSFPHGSAPVEWMAGSQSAADRPAGMLMFWIPGSVLQPRKNDPVDTTAFFQYLLMRVDRDSSSDSPLKLPAGLMK